MFPSVCPVVRSLHRTFMSLHSMLSSLSIILCPSVSLDLIDIQRGIVEECWTKRIMTIRPLDPIGYLRRP